MSVREGGGTPRVSILIPNFNNGRASSAGAKHDFMGQLLQSLHETLHNDPTPLEILAWDDGSTDDSLDSLRRAAATTWRGGQPFLTLHEAPHTGVLAKHSNQLVQRSRGEIFVRLDGDVMALTRHWVRLLCDTFDHAPARLGVIGPKQLRPDAMIHAFGDFVLHPKGYTHVGHGLPRYAFTRPLEVDHVMGAFYCCKRAVYDQIGGFDETFLRGQTIDFGLRARLHGWACYCVPHIEYVHFHGLRPPRKTTADSREGVDKALATFEAKWGFSRVAPDLDAVRQRYRGTPLLWNAHLFGAGAGDLPVTEPSTTLAPDASEWVRVGKEPAVRKALELRAHVMLDLIRQTARPARLGVLGCGDGVMLHALALQGLNCVGIERDAARADFARKAIASHDYPAQHPRPQVIHQPDPRRIPLDDAAVDMLLVLDDLHTLHNPVALLRDARRVLAKDGFAAVIAPRGHAATADAYDFHRPFHWHELHNLLKNTGWLVLSEPAKDDPARDLVLFARNVLSPAPAPGLNSAQPGVLAVPPRSDPHTQTRAHALTPAA